MLLSIVAAIMLLGAEPGSVAPPAKPSLEAGQIWKYASRPGEDASKLTILQIDQPVDGQTIVHIGISGLHIKSKDAPGGFVTEIQHVPIEKSALEKSLTELIGKAPKLPDFADGYREWKETDGGAFKGSVAEAIAFGEKQMNQ
jgi:hypothetical protein